MARKSIIEKFKFLLQGQKFYNNNNNNNKYYYLISKSNNQIKFEK